MVYSFKYSYNSDNLQINDEHHKFYPSYRIIAIKIHDKV